MAPATIAITVAALRFLLQHHIANGVGWLQDAIPVPKIPDALPHVLSPEEVLRFLANVPRLNVTSVQFQLDGSNLGAPVTAAPYSPGIPEPPKTGRTL